PDFTDMAPAGMPKRLRIVFYTPMEGAGIAGVSRRIPTGWQSSCKSTPNVTRRGDRKITRLPAPGWEGVREPEQRTRDHQGRGGLGGKRRRLVPSRVLLQLAARGPDV